MARYCSVYLTFPNITEARRAALTLLKEQLIACANLIPGVESHYVWKGKNKRSREVVALLKTERRLLPKLEAWVRKNHSYDVPCLVAWDISYGSKPFLDWISKEVRK